MIKGSLDKFYRFILDHEEIRTQLEKAVDIDEFSTIAVQLGQDNGFSFTEEEVKHAVQERQNQMLELTDEQLAVVAGGKDDGGSDDDLAFRPPGGEIPTIPIASRMCPSGSDGGSGGGGGLSWA